MEIHHKSPLKEDDIDVVPKEEVNPIEDENVNQEENSTGASTLDPLQFLMKEEEEEEAEECCDVDEKMEPSILEIVSEQVDELVPREISIEK